MGSATVYQLARSGRSVLGLEQFTIPHAFGSSHGSTRIIRLAYSEGPQYVPLLRAAYRYWRELEEVSGESILVVTGGLDIGPPDSPKVENSRRSCLEHGIPFEELDGAEVNRRFPGYRIPESLRAIHQADAGYVRSEVAIRAHTAGAWAGRLVPELASLCQPERQTMLWTEPLNAAPFAPERFPIFVLQAPLGRYYGFPSDRGEGFKIGKYHLRVQPVPDPDRLDRECSPENEAAVREGVAAYFPEANGPTRRIVACMFTTSPDEHFILDRHPAMDDVFIAAGFSGHGYKFCSVIGRIMADFCLGEEGKWGVEGFGLGGGGLGDETDVFSLAYGPVGGDSCSPPVATEVALAHGSTERKRRTS